MTLKEFKTKAEAEGVKDDMIISSIDIDYIQAESLDIDIEDNRVDIY